MRLKDLFTVPKGQKVTEKHLRRVLVSSICSILLCMSCLVSTTWAWFTVSIENKDNVIQIATVTADVKIIPKGNEIVKAENGGYDLSAGTYQIQINLQNDATETDDLNKAKNPVYVIMAIDQGEGVENYFFSLASGENTKNYELTFASKTTVISFSVSWVKPASTFATPIGSEPLTIGEMQTDSIEISTTVPSTENATDPTTEETTESSEPSAEVTTESSANGETDAGGDPPPEETTRPEETTGAATEATTASSSEAQTESSIETSTGAEPEETTTNISTEETTEST